MMTELKLGRHTVRGMSLAGMYTSLHVPELDALLDVGVALRSTCTAGRLFLSHAHVDHVGSLAAYLGMRGLSGVKRPLIVHLPAGTEDALLEHLRVLSTLHRWPLTFEPVPMRPGDELHLRGRQWVRAFKTFHPVPSLGYLFFERVQKLRPEHQGLPGAEIGRLRREGADIFDTEDHLQLAYATDTLPVVFEHTPELFEVDTLITECSFLDARKRRDAARAGYHIHLDDLFEAGYIERFANKALVLMHFSQLYKPPEVQQILDARLPPELRARTHALVPDGDRWWN
jgi:ribonuclease Z